MLTYHDIDALIASRKIDEGVEAIEHLLEKNPDDVEVLLRAARLSCEIGEVVSAATFFERVLEVNPSREDALVELIEMLVAQEAPDLALEAIDKYGSCLENAEFVSNLRGQIVKQLGESEATGSKQLKIAFVCGPDTKFITDIEREVGQIHDVRVLHFTRTVELGRIQEAMDWADVVWFEWFDNIIMHSAQKLKKTAKIICRLHSYEALTDWPTQFDWSFVDSLVLVAPHIRDILLSKVPALEKQTVVQVIPNGINTQEFEFVDRKPGFDLAFVANINHKKNPAFLIQLAHELVKIDERYKIHIAGAYQEQRYQIYIEHMIESLGLNENIIHYGWISDINSWLQNKQYIVSTSVHEGCPYNILEGAARGLKPVIHNFWGADRLFPRDWLFNTTREFISKITESDYDSRRYRKVVEENYSFKSQLDSIITVIDMLGKNRTLHTEINGESQPLANRVHHVITRPETDRNGTVNWITFNESTLPFLRGERFTNSLRLKIAGGRSEVQGRIELIKHLVTGKRVLDLGCTDHAPLIENKIRQGNWLHGIVASAAQECIGIDVNSEGINLANRLGYHVVKMDVERDPVPDVILRQKWDYLLIGEVLEHIADPTSFLLSISSKLSDYVDRIIITVPNAFRIENYKAAIACEEIINSDHKFWFTPYTLAKVLWEGGFNPERFCFIQSYLPGNKDAVEYLSQNPAMRDGLLMEATCRRLHV
jgi:glycosyltransferase involved in cell wall biosynthesis/2-polyprenyl-3-methyl-5-hydroxy-6-metoxy-1,4-benzoquinol methylase